MKLTCLIPLAVMIAACRPSANQQDSLLNRSEVPSSHRDYGQLGQAYQANQKRLLNVTCATGQISEAQGNTEAQFDLNVDLGFSEVLDRLGGKLSVDVNFPVVRAGAAARYAQEMAASEHVNNYHFSWRITPKKRILVPGTYQLTEIGRRFAEDPESNLAQRCGNEFITAIEYGASLNVNLRMEYRNESDKKDIGGKIKVGVGGGIDIVSVAGDLDYLDQNIKKSVKISVQAIQRGGKPLNLLNIIPNNLITCTLEHPEPCFQVFAEAVRYAKDDLINQFDGPDTYNIVKYHTESYEESGLDELVDSEGNPVVDILVENARIKLDEKFQEALLDQERAAKLISTYREWLTDEQYDLLRVIERNAKSNARFFAQTAIFCYDNPFQGCLDRVDSVEQNITIYDRKYLTIEAASVSEAFRCEYARLKAIEIGEVSPEFALGYRRKGWAPIYVNNARPEEGVVAWGPCSQALKSYGNYFKSWN